MHRLDVAERSAVPDPLPLLDWNVTAGCADVDPRMSCMHNRLIKLFGGTVCMRHAIRVNHTEIRCRLQSEAFGGNRITAGWGMKSLTRCCVADSRESKHKGEVWTLLGHLRSIQAVEELALAVPVY